MKRLALAISVLAVSTTGALAYSVYNWIGSLGGPPVIVNLCKKQCDDDNKCRKAPTGSVHGIYIE